MRWFKCYGTPYDPKLLSVAKCARAKVSDVLSVWSALMFHQSSGGSIEDFDNLAHDLFCRFREGTTERIIKCAFERGLLVEMPEDIAEEEVRSSRTKQAERQARYREKKSRETTECDAPGVTRDGARDGARDASDITRDAESDAPRDGSVTPVTPYIEENRIEENREKRSERSDQKRDLSLSGRNAEGVTQGVTHNGDSDGNGDAASVTRNATGNATETSSQQAHSRQRSPKTFLRAEDFSAWWEQYPRKESKKPAIESWLKCIKRGELPSLDALLSALSWQKKSRQWADPQYIPLPTTYLNQNKWEDKPQQPSLFSPPSPGGSPFGRMEDPNALTRMNMATLQDVLGDMAAREQKQQQEDAIDVTP